MRRFLLCWALYSFRLLVVLLLGLLVLAGVYASVQVFGDGVTVALVVILFLFVVAGIFAWAETHD